MESLDNYYNKTIFIENKQGVINEILHAYSCLLTHRLTFKQLYLIIVLSTAIIYSFFAFLYAIYGAWMLSIWNFSYVMMAGIIIRFYYSKYFNNLAMFLIYAINEVWLGVLIYALGFGSGLWFFYIFMMYFVAVVTLENIKYSKIILASEVLTLLILYFCDIFLWEKIREVDAELVHIVFILSFFCALGIFLFLSIVCSIKDITILENTKEKTLQDLEQYNKSRFGLNIKKHFIAYLNILSSKHEKQSKTTHFALVDFSYNAKYSNSNWMDNLKTKVDMFITSTIKLYFPDTSFISHWDENQYMFLMFDKKDSEAFSLMQIFLRECRENLQNRLMQDVNDIRCACACATFGDFSNINLKQAIYETQKLLYLSQNYDKDSIYLVNYNHCEK